MREAPGRRHSAYVSSNRTIGNKPRQYAAPEKQSEIKVSLKNVSSSQSYFPNIDICESHNYSSTVFSSTW